MSSNTQQKTGRTSAVICFGSPAIFFPKEVNYLRMEKTRRFPSSPHSEFGFIGTSSQTV